MDAVNRSCTVSAVSGKYMVKLLMTFPAMYPSNACPAFQFAKPTNIDKTAQTELIRVSESSRDVIDRVLASRVSGCLFGTLVHEKCLFWGEKTPYLLVRFF